MKYRVVCIIGKERTVMAEVISKEWADTFAEEVKAWNIKYGGYGLFEVFVEEI